jgi:hypothetical protein
MSNPNRLLTGLKPGPEIIVWQVITNPVDTVANGAGSQGCDGVVYAPVISAITDEDQGPAAKMLGQSDDKFIGELGNLVFGVTRLKHRIAMEFDNCGSTSTDGGVCDKSFVRYDKRARVSEEIKRVGNKIIEVRGEDHIAS